MPSLECRHRQPWISLNQEFQDRWSHTCLDEANGTRIAVKIFGNKDGLVSSTFADVPEYQKRGILSCAQQCHISNQIQDCERSIHWKKDSLARVRVARCLVDYFNWNYTEDEEASKLSFIYDFPVGGGPLVYWWREWGYSLPLLNQVKCIRSLMRQLYSILKLLLEDCKSSVRPWGGVQGHHPHPSHHIIIFHHHQPISCIHHFSHHLIILHLHFSYHP